MTAVGKFAFRRKDGVYVVPLSSLKALTAVYNSVSTVTRYLSAVRRVMSVRSPSRLRITLGKHVMA